MRSPCWRVLILLIALCGAAPASAMSFSLSRLPDNLCAEACPQVIVATGEIELNSDEAFFRFVTDEVVKQQVTNMVLMSSPGGNLVGSLKLGILMRQLGFSIMVGQVRSGAFLSARCYSACAYALAGGMKRIVPEGSEVGVHKAWTLRRGEVDRVTGASIDEQVATEGYAPVLTRYLRMMGVSGQLMALANATPSSSIRVLTRAELARLRVVTPEPKRRKRRG